VIVDTPYTRTGNASTQSDITSVIIDIVLRLRSSPCGARGKLFATASIILQPLVRNILDSHTSSHSLFLTVVVIDPSSVENPRMRE
jgi:hypothetical protein